MLRERSVMALGLPSPAARESGPAVTAFQAAPARVRLHRHGLDRALGFPSAPAALDDEELHALDFGHRARVGADTASTASQIANYCGRRRDRDSIYWPADLH